jgi:hypothetical protein
MSRNRQQPLDSSPQVDGDVLSGDDLMRRVFYDAPLPPRVTQPAPVVVERPTHYRVLSISLYTEDIERLDALVKALKERGHTKANRSSLIRFALDQVDIEKMPRGY